MLSLKALQQKLLEEVIPNYNKSIEQATSTNEVETCSRSMFDQVQKLVLPDLKLKLSNTMDPKDKSNFEERKENPSLTEEVT